jgi:hypothetical protein
MIYDFDYRSNFVRESDGKSGHILFKNDKARLVVVEFQDGSVIPYDYYGRPLMFYDHEHRLISKEAK